MKTTLIGKKIGMTQVYLDSGELVPVTVIQAGPCPITQIKTVARDGYNAIQISYGYKKAKSSTRAAAGHFKISGNTVARVVREVRLEEPTTQSLGDLLSLEAFANLEKVDVIGTTKGRGFQGVMKRWDFAGGPASHGSMFHRRGGSYGMRQWPGHVMPGKKMPGQFGCERSTVQNLQVVKVLVEKNLILVKGSVPGPNGSTVLVRTAVKQRKHL